MSATAPYVHAGEDNTIRVALVGCGGRGTGAAIDALSTKNGPIKLVAMADAYEDRLKGSVEILKEKMTSLMDVPGTGSSSGSMPTRRPWTA